MSNKNQSVTTDKTCIYKYAIKSPIYKMAAPVTANPAVCYFNARGKAVYNIITYH